VKFAADLPAAWVSIHVPGTPEPSRLSTYVRYPHDKLPALPADATELAWLNNAPRHPEDDMAHACAGASLDLSARGVAARLVGGPPLPGDFARFLEGGLRDRLRSATDCYFDLADFAVDVDGGRLLHLVSDSQWTFHWLLCLGEDGTSAVIGTDAPVGFTCQDDEDRREVRETTYLRVADSFAEFAWRWWMDNQIFYRVHVERSAMSPEQRSYANSYGIPSLL
jgi:hypothetical protein